MRRWEKRREGKKGEVPGEREQAVRGKSRESLLITPFPAKRDLGCGGKKGRKEEKRRRRFS